MENYIDKNNIMVARESQELINSEKWREDSEFKTKRLVAETLKELIAYTVEDTEANCNQMITEINTVIGNRLEKELNRPSKPTTQSVEGLEHGGNKELKTE